MPQGAAAYVGCLFLASVTNKTPKYLNSTKTKVFIQIWLYLNENG
jgi:hypothetical protein